MVLVHKADAPIAQQTTTKELPGMPNSTLNDVVFCHVFKESGHIAEARNHHWDKLSDPQFFQSIAKRKSNTISAECLNCWSNTPDLLLSSSTRWPDFQPRTLPNVPLVTSSSNPLTSSIAFTTSNGGGSSTGTLATSSMHRHYRLNFPHAPQTLQGRRSPIVRDNESHTQRGQKFALILSEIGPCSVSVPCFISNYMRHRVRIYTHRMHFSSLQLGNYQKISHSSAHTTPYVSITTGLAHLVTLQRPIACPLRKSSQTILDRIFDL